MERRFAHGARLGDGGIQDCRKHKESAAVVVRKSRRGNIVAKKRQQLDASEAPDQGTEWRDDETFKLNVDLLNGTDADGVHAGVLYMRKLLSFADRPPIDRAIGANIVPRLVQLAGDFDRPDSQYEAAWCLTNIASGSQEQTAVVYRAGAGKAFMDLLQYSQSPLTKEQGVWGLSNICGDSTLYRDQLLSDGLAGLLLPLLAHRSIQTFERNLAWMATNLSRGKKPPAHEHCASILQLITKLMDSSDTAVLVDLAWSLAYLVDSGDRMVAADAVVEPLPNMMSQWLLNDNESLRAGSLRYFGCLAAGENWATQAALNAGVLSHLPHLLQISGKTARREICWLVSNVAAGTPNQVDDLVASGLLVTISQCIDNDDSETTTECYWAIGNAFCGGSQDCRDDLIELGLFARFSEILNHPAPDVYKMGLHSLQILLAAGKPDHSDKPEENIYRPVCIKHSIPDILKNGLCANDNQKRHTMLLDTYFPDFAGY